MPYEMEGETYLDTAEACKELDISRQTLYNLVKEKRLKRYKKGITRTTYYKKVDIDRLNTLREDDRNK